jgi:type III pantothenate kinase
VRLLVDIGNTQVKYIFQQEGELAAFSAIVYLDYQSFHQVLNTEQFSIISEVIVANVQDNEIMAAIEAWSSRENIAFLQVHSQAQAFGVFSSYQQPSRLGVDRWLTMIAAHQLYPEQNVIIVDAGTATTIDLLDANGRHLGGWIMPGIQTMYDSLLSNTQKIIADPINIASVAFGANSSECLNYGIWAMTVGSVKEAIIQANEKVTLDKIILTGGNGQQIADLIQEDCELVPELLFHGLSCFKAS